MRSYGRIYDLRGNPTWVEVDTDANGYNDQVYLTTLAQCLKLNLGESPFYANYGIPQYQTVVTQVFPDFYVMFLQTQFAAFFASLVISKVASSSPSYNIRAVTNNGSTINQVIPV